MPESTESTAGPTETEATGTEGTTEETTKPTETVDFWKSKAREQEKRAKANADAAEKLAKLEDQQKTETQRLSDQLAAEKAQRETLEQQAMRFRVAAIKGVPADLIDRLRGDTEEELEADADKLLELVTPKETAGTTPAPRPDLSQGGSGNGTALNGDPLLNDLKSKLGIS